MIVFNFLSIFQVLIIIVVILIAVAYTTLLERKILAVIQRRQGPNVIGVFGLLQPLADGFKLLIKETVIPSNSNKFIFVLAPILSFLISLLGWAVIPFGEKSFFVDISLGALYLLTVSSLGVYGVVLAGWASNSKYAFLGSLRSTAQMISYELAISFNVLAVSVCCGSLNMNTIVEFQAFTWYIFPLLPGFFLFFTAGLAETNRHPFDLPEAESELVSGYNVEYSAMGFALFSLAEYSNILMICTLTSILFFGGYSAPVFFLFFFPGAFWFGLKIVCFLILFIYSRAALPRFRYDQLMRLGWKILFPLSFSMVLLNVAIISTFNIYPY
jgi:NADH-quinone oxidoreductase subunit H